MGGNGHLYRRKEYEHIKEVAEDFMAAYSSNTNLLYKEYKTLYNEYRLIENAPSLIRNSNDNPLLIKEINPWLLQFELIGKSGQCALGMINKLNQNDYDGYWDKFQRIMELEKEINYINDNYNRNPYQPGVKSASLVMKPLIDSLTTISADVFYVKLSGVEIPLTKSTFHPILEPQLHSPI